MGRYGLLKWILEILCDGVGWIQFVQDKNQWRNLVHMVLSLSYLYKVGNNEDQLNDYQLHKKGSASWIWLCTDFRKITSITIASKCQSAVNTLMITVI
jgi:hypothetical protein